MSLIQGAEFKRLREALPTITKQTRVPEKYIHTSCLGVVDDSDVRFLKDYWESKKKGIAGYLKLGGSNSSKKFSYMAGAFIRNFIDARIYTLEQCLNLDSDQIQASVIFVPDFCPDLVDAKPMPSWKLQQVYSFLITRQSLDKMNVLYVHDSKMAKKLLGSSIIEHLENNYIRGRS